MNKWAERFFKLAKQYASWSKDPSTKVGCVITQGKFQVSQGFNGLPSGVYDDQALLSNRKLRLSMTLHAELNAILKARKSDLVNAILYVTAPPCAACSAAIIQTGIAKVCYLKASDSFMDRWGDNVRFGLNKLKEAGIIVMAYDAEEEEED